MLRNLKLVGLLSLTALLAIPLRDADAYCVVDAPLANHSQTPQSCRRASP